MLWSFRFFESNPDHHLIMGTISVSDKLTARSSSVILNNLGMVAPFFSLNCLITKAPHFTHEIGKDIKKKVLNFCGSYSYQVDYILGDNPVGMSYMVGYGARYPQRIHHRGSSLPSVQAHPAHIGCKAGGQYFLSPNPNPNVHVGAVVGGPNVTDAFPDSRPYFQESEPTTYINAPLVGLLAYFSAHY